MNWIELIVGKNLDRALETFNLLMMINQFIQESYQGAIQKLQNKDQGPSTALCGGTQPIAVPQRIKAHPQYVVSPWSVVDPICMCLMVNLPLPIVCRCQCGQDLRMSNSTDTADLHVKPIYIYCKGAHERTGTCDVDKWYNDIPKLLHIIWEQMHIHYI